MGKLPISTHKLFVFSCIENSFAFFGKLIKNKQKTLDKYVEIEYYIQALFECKLVVAQ